MVCRCQGGPERELTRTAARAQDKRRAEDLMVAAVQGLAARHGHTLTEERAEQIVAAEATRRHAAYLAYGEGLVARLSGETEGPPLVHLWRLISRDSHGHVRREFELFLEDFRRAENVLVKVMIRLAN